MAVEDYHPPFVQTVESSTREQLVTRHDYVAEWPVDERAQRAWCIQQAVALQQRFVLAKDDDGTTELINAANELLAYVNDGSVPADA